ncbi:uncharacterized protein LOC144580568 isoform X2 [Callithrix jacchus]
MPAPPSRPTSAPRPGRVPAQSPALAPETRLWVNKADELATGQYHPHAPPTGTPNSSPGTPLPHSSGPRLARLGGGSGRNSGPPNIECARAASAENKGAETRPVRPQPARGPLPEGVPGPPDRPPAPPPAKGLLAAPAAGRGGPVGRGCGLLRGGAAWGSREPGLNSPPGPALSGGSMRPAGSGRGAGDGGVSWPRRPNSCGSDSAPAPGAAHRGSNRGAAAAGRSPRGGARSCSRAPAPSRRPPQPQDRCGPARTRVRPLLAPGPAAPAPLLPPLPRRPLPPTPAPPTPSLPRLPPPPPRTTPDPAAASQPWLGVRGSCALTGQPRSSRAPVLLQQARGCLSEHTRRAPDSAPCRRAVGVPSLLPVTLRRKSPSGEGAKHRDEPSVPMKTPPICAASP